MKRRAFFRIIAGAAAMAALPALAHVDPADVERERAIMKAVADLWKHARDDHGESPVIYMHPDDYFAIVADVEECTIDEARERFPLNPAPWEGET